MEAVILVIHLIVALGIIAAVLVQPAEAGGFLGSGGGNAMTPRRSADTMTRLTTILAGTFFATSLLLAILASRAPAEKSILDIAGEAAPAVEKTVTPDAPAAPVEKKAPTAPLSK